MPQTSLQFAVVCCVRAFTLCMHLAYEIVWRLSATVEELQATATPCVMANIDAACCYSFVLFSRFTFASHIHSSSAQAERKKTSNRTEIILILDYDRKTSNVAGFFFARFLMRDVSQQSIHQISCVTQLNLFIVLSENRGKWTAAERRWWREREGQGGRKKEREIRERKREKKERQRKKEVWKMPAGPTRSIEMK